MFNFLAQAQTGQVNRFVDTIARTPLSKIVMLAVVLTVIRLLLAPYLKSVPKHRRTGLYDVARFVDETFLDAVIYAGVFVFLIIRPFFLQMFQIPSESMLDTLKVGDFIVANKAIYRYTDPKVNDVVVFRPPIGAIQDVNFIDSDGQVNQDFIKRCVGTPGDVVETRDRTLYRNGQKPSESFVRTSDGLRQAPPYFKLVYYTGPYAPFHNKYIPVTADYSFGEHPRVNTSSGIDFGVGVADVQTDTDGIRRWRAKSDDELTPEERKLNQDLCDLPPVAVPEGRYLMVGDNRDGSFDGRFWGLIRKSEVIGRAEFVIWPLSRFRKIPH